MSTRIIFCGDRYWKDRVVIRERMGELFKAFPDLEIIEGEAPGADSMSRSEADLTYQIPVHQFPANWNEFGKAAGPIRNELMLKRGKAEGVCAFHADLMKSKGTADMVKRALKAGLPVWTYEMGVEAFPRFIEQLQHRKGK